MQYRRRNVAMADVDGEGCWKWKLHVALRGIITKDRIFHSNYYFLELGVIFHIRFSDFTDIEIMNFSLMKSMESLKIRMTSLKSCFQCSYQLNEIISKIDLILASLNQRVSSPLQFFLCSLFFFITPQGQTGKSTGQNGYGQQGRVARQKM